MAYIEIFPKSPEAQERVWGERDALMPIIQKVTKDILCVPDHDIIIELNQCTVIAFNPSAKIAGAVADVIIKISTSDHYLQPKFQILCDQIVSSWDAHFGKTLKMELWINLIDSWGCNIEFS